MREVRKCPEITNKRRLIVLTLIFLKVPTFLIVFNGKKSILKNIDICIDREIPVLIVISSGRFSGKFLNNKILYIKRSTN